MIDVDQTPFLEEELDVLRRELDACERAPLDGRVADTDRWLRKRASLRHEVWRLRAALEDERLRLQREQA